MSAKVYGVISSSSGNYVQVALQLCAVIARDQDCGGVIGHPDQCVYPEIPFLDGCLARRKIPIDNEEVCAGAD
jgi:hypothetical protein